MIYVPLILSRFVTGVSGGADTMKRPPQAATFAVAGFQPAMKAGGARGSVWVDP